MDERTFLVALIIQKPQNGITCFTQVCTSYCRFDCIMCLAHTHTDIRPCHTLATHTFMYAVKRFILCGRASPHIASVRV